MTRWGCIRPERAIVSVAATRSAARKIRARCGFARVTRKAGETRTVTLTVPATAQRRWSTEQNG